MASAKNIRITAMTPYEQIHHDLSYVAFGGFTLMYLGLLEYGFEMLVFGRSFYGLLPTLFVIFYVVNKRIL